MAQATPGSTCHGCLSKKAKARKYAQRLLPAQSTCYCCGAPATTMDHELPLSSGGTDHSRNLAPMCKPCNNSKYNRDRCYLEHGTKAKGA